MTFQPSSYQQAIFDFVENGTGHAVVQAVAGSGKTTTIVQALNHIPSDSSVLFLAFNRHIVNELKDRVPYNVQVATLNAFGWRVCKSFDRYAKLDQWKTDSILRNYVKDNGVLKKVKGPINKLVSLGKALGLRVMAEDDVTELMARYDILPPQVEGFDLNSMARLVFKDSTRNTQSYDFDDQMYQPVVQGLKLPEFDWVFVDEAQDLSPIQIELIGRLL